MTRLLPLAAVAALALTAGACATASGGKSPAEGAAVATAKAGPGATSGAGGEETGKKKPWWRLSQYSRGPAYESREDRYRKRPGLLSGKEGGFVLYREGEAGGSSDPSKPTKARR